MKHSVGLEHSLQVRPTQDLVTRIKEMVSETENS